MPAQWIIHHIHGAEKNEMRPELTKVTIGPFGERSISTNLTVVNSKKYVFHHGVRWWFFCQIGSQIHSLCSCTAGEFHKRIILTLPKSILCIHFGMYQHKNAILSSASPASDFKCFSNSSSESSIFYRRRLFHCPRFNTIILSNLTSPVTPRERLAFAVLS